MIQRLGVTFVCSLLLVTAMPALAQGPDYSLFEGGVALYPNFESEPVIGADLRASKALNTEYFAFAGFKALAGDVEVTALHAGAGYRHPLDHRTDAWAGVTAEYQDIQSEDCETVTVGGAGRFRKDCYEVSTDDIAPGLRGGIRRQVHRDLEIGASARLITGDMDYLGFTATGRYHWQQDIHVLVEADFYDGNFGLIGGLSVSF